MNDQNLFETIASGPLTCNLSNCVSVCLIVYLCMCDRCRPSRKQYEDNVSPPDIVACRPLFIVRLHSVHEHFVIFIYLVYDNMYNAMSPIK